MRPKTPAPRTIPLSIPENAPKSSWWLEPMSRETFDARVQQEAPRMLNSRLGQFARMSTPEAER